MTTKIFKKIMDFFSPSSSLYNSHMIFDYPLILEYPYLCLKFSLPNTSQICCWIRTFLFFKTQLQSSHQGSLPFYYLFILDFLHWGNRNPKCKAVVLPRPSKGLSTQ